MMMVSTQAGYKAFFAVLDVGTCAALDACTALGAGACPALGVGATDGIEGVGVGFPEVIRRSIACNRSHRAL